MSKVLITGAAGNLGGLLANYLKDTESLNLNLMIHKNDLSEELVQHPKVKVFRADLSKKETLNEALAGANVVIHFAGVLFKANPEKFLPVTNTIYFKNLLEKAVENKVQRIILISFPHVEGETSPEKPANGSLDKIPISMHAKTRLEEEKLLFEAGRKYKFESVSLRVGMVYGKGILMIDAARWFAKHHLLGIWKKPTWIHLISIPDFLESTKQAMIKNGIHGIYHLGDDGRQTLQKFLDDATAIWGYRRPWRMPVKMIFSAAWIFELFSLVFKTRSPLTRDFIKIGMISYYGDTSRMRSELIRNLKYETYKDGINTLK